jgi:ribose transport system substrate-binding protein
MIRESNDQDAAGQVTLLNNFLARRNVAALVLAPASDTETVPTVAQFNKNHIPVVLIDTPLREAEMTKHGAKMDVFIGSDNKDGGRKAGGVMATALEGKGSNVLLIKGSFVHQSAIDRAEGFEQIAKQHGLVVESADGEWKPLKAQEITHATLSRNPIHGIFASNDDMAMGVIQALKLLKRPKSEWPVVIGFDATKDGLQAIEDGEMYASIKQDPTFLGEEGVNSAIGLLKRDPSVQASRLLPTSVVPDRSNKFK